MPDFRQASVRSIVTFENYLNLWDMGKRDKSAVQSYLVTTFKISARIKVTIKSGSGNCGEGRKSWSADIWSSRGDRGSTHQQKTNRETNTELGQGNTHKPSEKQEASRKITQIPNNPKEVHIYYKASLINLDSLCCITMADGNECYCSIATIL